jgi:hypothetical protein
MHSDYLSELSNVTIIEDSGKVLDIINVQQEMLRVLNCSLTVIIFILMYCHSLKIRVIL